MLHRQGKTIFHDLACAVKTHGDAVLEEQ